MTTTTPAPRKRRSFIGRLFRYGVPTLLLVVGGAIALAPTIASRLAPGIAASSITGSINGKATVDRVSLGWGSKQEIGPVTVFDDKGAQVATVTLELDKGLFSLARAALAGPMDLGEVRVKGSANLVRNADGTLNVERLAKKAPATTPSTTPSTPAPSTTPQPAKLPPGLKAKLVLDALEVNYRDLAPGAAVGSVKIPKFAGTASFDNGALNADLTAPVLYGSGDQATTQGGQLAIKASATNLTDASGTLTLDRAVVDASIDLANLAVTAADAIAGTKGGLVEALGETLGAKLTLKGNAGKADANVLIQSKGINADIALVADNGVLTAPRPGVINIKTAGARKLLKIDEALAAPSTGKPNQPQQVTLGVLPDLKIALDALKINLPVDPKNLAPRPLDLRTGAVTLAITTTEITGTALVPDGSGPGSMKDFRVAPIAMTLQSADLAGPITLKGGSSATLAGQPAGALNVDITAAGALDDKGAPRSSGPTQLQGSVTLAQLATAIAQPIVQASGLDLPRGVGPTLDLTLSAKADPSAAAGGAIPPTDLDLKIASAGVNGSLALMLDATALKTRNNTGVITIRSIADLAGAAAQKSGIELAQGGSLAAQIRSINVPLNLKKDESLSAKAAIDAGIQLTGLAVRPIAQPGAPTTEPVRVDTLAVAANMQPGSPPKLSINGTGSHTNNPYTIAGAFELIGLRPIIDGAAKPYTLRPVGSLKIENLPTTLVGVAMPTPPAQPNQPAPLDVARLVRDAIGPALNVNLTTTRKGNDGVALTLDTTAANLVGKLVADADPAVGATLSTLDFRTTISPELARSLLDSFGPKLESTPTLATPAALTITATPVTIPFSEPYKPDFAKAGDASITLAIAGKTLINNIVTKDETGKSRDIGPLGLEDVRIAANLPLKTLAPGSAAQPAKVDITAGVLGDATNRIVNLAANAVVNLAGGQPQGDLNANFKLGVTDLMRVDQLLGKPGRFAGAVGKTIAIDASSTVSFPKAGAPTGAMPFDRAVAKVNIDAPKFKTTKPLALTAAGDRVSLDTPTTITWAIAPGWANRELLGVSAEPSADPKAKPDALRLQDAMTVEVALNALAAALPSTVNNVKSGPLKPGIFNLDAAITSPGTTVIVDGQPAPFRGIRLVTKAGPTPGRADFTLAVDNAGLGQGENGKPALNFTGFAAGIADAAGNVTADAAKLTLEGVASPVNTAIVDALAKQKGVLAEALGPTAALTLKARDLHKTPSGAGGDLDVAFKSPRAELALKGTIQGNAFVSQGEPEIKLLEITPKLGEKLVKGLPQVGSFQKQLADLPAVVKASGLTVPLDGNMAGLNGDLTLSLGQMQFTTTEIFGSLLKTGGGKAAGVLGRRIEPFNMQIRQGVATYDKFTLPLGEFALATRGTVDLVNERLDVITYIPFGAVTDETARLFKAGGIGDILGGALEKSAQLPFRTAGTFDKNDTKPDLKLFAEEAGKNLTKPENIGNVLDGLLKKKEKK